MERSSTRYSGDQLGPRSSGPSAGLKKSSSDFIPSSNSQHQQSRSVRDHFEEVRERRRQLEEQRQEELKKKMTEKERQRKRAQEIKRRPLSSKHPSAKAKTVTIVVDSGSSEPSEPQKTKAKPTQLSVSVKTVSTPKIVTSVTPTSPPIPRSPLSPKAEQKKLRKPSPTKKILSINKSSQSKKTPPSVKKEPVQKSLSSFRKVKKQQKNLQTPPILEITEPTGSEDSSTTDETHSYASMSIYYKGETEVKEPTKQLSFGVASSSVDNVNKEIHRRVTCTVPAGPVDHPDKRKASHPTMKFPEKVEYGKKFSQYEDLTTPELERRKREYKPKHSATADYVSLREGGASLLLEPTQPKTPISAPVSRVTTPSSSPTNSPKRHMVSCTCGKLYYISC